MRCSRSRSANTNGCPVTTAEAGVPVTFTAPASGASGTFSASGSNTVTVGTNASGQANAPGFTANGSAGSYTVTASSDYGSVTFSLTNTASGIAATITPGAPASQSATAGSRYPQPLQATVLDANGNPVDGATVTFTLGSSGGGGRRRCEHCGCELRRRSRPGDRAHRLLGHCDLAPVHRQRHRRHVHRDRRDGGCRRAGRLLARQPRRQAAHDQRSRTGEADGDDRRPLRQAVAGEAARRQRQAVAGSDRDVHARLRHKRRRAGAGGSAGAGASFADGSSQATETTDASGVATSPRFSANTTAGRFTATATTTGTSEVVSFSLDNLAGKPPTITPLAPAKQSATTGARYRKPLRVKVRDGHGDPLQGATVTFTLGSAASGGGAGTGGSAGAGGSFADGSSQATETTNASGIATSPHFTANTTAGRFAATAATTGTADVAALLARQPRRQIAHDHRRQARRSGRRSSGPITPSRCRSKVRDASGKPLQGANVTFTLGASGGSSGGAGSGSAAAATFVGGIEPGDRSHQRRRHRDLAAADREHHRRNLRRDRDHDRHDQCGELHASQPSRQAGDDHGRRRGDRVDRGRNALPDPARGHRRRHPGQPGRRDRRRVLRARVRGDGPFRRQETHGHGQDRRKRRRRRAVVRRRPHPGRLRRARDRGRAFRGVRARQPARRLAR